MLDQLISRYKNYKKQGFLRQPERYTQKYAFVGAGGHSIDNLYPVLDFLAVPLRYVVTRQRQNAERMAQRYAGAKGTDSLEEVLRDPEVGGVFICTHPKLHFELVKQVLEAGKAVFVEKPPCFSTQELQTLGRLSEEAGKPCVVGLQKRYATVYELLRKEVKQPIQYQMRYLTGAYPEGDPLWDLFIHPLDLLVFLFGEAQLLSLQRAQDTLFVHLRHAGGTLGSLTLSTAYNWQAPTEWLEVQSSQGVFVAQQMQSLAFTPAPKKVLGVPLEKVLPQPLSTQQLYHNSGFVPLRQFNPLYAHGYKGAIETFLGLSEGKKAENRSSPRALKATFELLEGLTKGV